MKHTFIQRAFTKRLTTEQAKHSYVGLFDLNKWFKEVAAYFGVQTFDPCCTSGTGFPVRLKLDKSGIEYLDIDGVWKDVQTP